MGFVYFIIAAGRCIKKLLRTGPRETEFQLWLMLIMRPRKNNNKSHRGFFVSFFNLYNPIPFLRTVIWKFSSCLLIFRERSSDGSNLQSAGIIIKLRLLLHRSRLKSDTIGPLNAAVGFGTRRVQAERMCVSENATAGIHKKEFPQCWAAWRRCCRDAAHPCIISDFIVKN